MQSWKTALEETFLKEGIEVQMPVVTVIIDGSKLPFQAAVFSLPPQIIELHYSHLDTQEGTTVNSLCYSPTESYYRHGGNCSGWKIMGGRGAWKTREKREASPGLIIGYQIEETESQTGSQRIAHTLPGVPETLPEVCGVIIIFIQILRKHKTVKWILV